MSSATRKARRALARKQKAAVLSGVDDSRAWIRIFDSYPGAWQANVTVDRDAVIANWAVFACMTLIAGDVGKLPLRLMEQGADRIWRETRSPAFSPVMNKPNSYQTRQKFIESWMFSKLSQGNTYALKVRDNRGVVTALHVLDPSRVKPLVSERGEVFYQLGDDELAGLESDVPAAPASEIIHDRMWCIFHPLVGLSPIFASGLAATQGLNIQGNSSKFFANMSRPSGILTAPGSISDAVADRIKTQWEKNYGADNVGRTAVLGDGLKYEAMAITPQDALLVEQLKISSEMVCSTFHVPGYKVGVGPMPTYQNAQILNQIYYSDCLQVQIEAIESLIDEGLGLTAAGYGSEFDLDALLLMDSQTKAEVEGTKVQRGISAPDEARSKFNLPPVPGGSLPYLQQQNYSLEALAKRDGSADPFGSAAAPAPAVPQKAAEVDNSRFDALQDEMRAMRELLEAEREHAKAADSRRSSQLAELLADVHREIEVLQTAQQSEAQRTEYEVNAIQRRAALDAFARSLECSTTNQMH